MILFGGSFDPIHFGHLHMAKAALKAIHADQVIFIPAKYPRWKQTPGREEDRIAMLQLALKGEKRFSLSLIEIQSETGGHYTIDTVTQFLEKEKNAEIFYLIGEDQLEKLHEWHDIERLSSLVHFLAYGRNDAIWSQKSLENANRYQVKRIEGKTSSTSSTAIRELHSIDTPISVLRYMVEHHLYAYQKVYDLMDERRYAHSASVAFLAYQIGKSNHYRKEACFISAILHDIGKKAEKEEKGLEIMQTLYPNELDLPRWSYHQFIGAYYAKHLFHIEDEEILDAIAYHCTGKEKMSRIGKIVYAADKIDPLRGYDSSDMIRACIKDDTTGFLYVLKENLIYLEGKSKDIHNRYSDACFTYYLTRKETNNE